MGKKKSASSPEKAKVSPPKKVKVANELFESMMDTASDSGSEISPGQAAGPSQDAAAVDAPQWFLKYMNEFENRLELKLASKLSKLEAKMKESDDKISASTIIIEELERKISNLKVANKEMEKKFDDMENRSRRNNLVFKNIPERPDKSTFDVLNEVLDFIGIPAEGRGIERCHRTPTHSIPVADGSRPHPRIIHVNFNSFLTKESIRKASVKKFKEEKFLGTEKLFVSDDFSKKVLDQRKNKKDEMERLRRDGKRPFFLFPAKVAFKDSAGKLHVVG